MLIRCPECETELVVDEKYCGEICQCPNCSGEIAVPFENEMSSPKKNNSLSFTGTQSKKKNDTPYKSPMLAVIFRITGLLSFILAVLVILGYFVGSNSYTPFELFIAVLVFIVNGLVHLGISGILENIAKTAFYTEKTFNHIEMLVDAQN